MVERSVIYLYCIAVIAEECSGLNKQSLEKE
jgi:hypothetical protein